MMAREADDPPEIIELMRWCSARIEGREARRSRAPALFAAFGEIVRRASPTISVSGTAGKGTMCALLESVLTASGHVVGLFTKPHLVSFAERIRVAGRAVSDDVLCRHVRLALPLLEEFVRRHGQAFRPSLFEALIVVAHSVFQERGATARVFEAAIGGSNDAVSFLPADLGVITSVGLDHQDQLGHSLQEIAKDKAGIVEPGGTLVIGAGIDGPARRAALAEAASRNVRCVEADADAIEVVSSGMNGQTLRFREGGTSRTVFLPFAGPCQKLNFATLRSVVRIMHERGHVGSMDALSAVEHARLPGRFEFIRGSPSWLLDVAHNVLSVAALAGNVASFLGGREIAVVFGATEPHDHRGMAGILCSLGARVGVVEGFPRAIPAALLAVGRPRSLGTFLTPSEAIDFLIRDPAHAATTVVVTGSLLLVGRWRQELARRGLLPEEGD